MKDTLFVFHSLDRLAGGVDNRLSELELALSNRGKTAFLLYKNIVNLDHTGDVSFVATPKIPTFIPRYKRALKPFVIIIGILLFFVRVFKTRAFIKKTSFHTVVALDDYFGAIMLVATIGINVRKVVSSRNSWCFLYKKGSQIHLMPDFFYTKVCAKLYNRYADFIHTVSVGVAKEMREQFHIKRADTIYNLYDFSRIDTMKDQQPVYIREEPYFFTAGNLNQQKNHKEMLDAYKIVRNNGVTHRLVIAGGGPLLQELQIYAVSIGVQEFVDFIGKVNNPYAIMKNATQFLLSSLAEGFPSVIVEAAYLKIPIASYNCHFGVDEIVENPTRMNPQALAREILKNNGDTAYRNTGVEKRFRKVQELFSKENILNRWESVIDGNV